MEKDPDPPTNEDADTGAGDDARFADEDLVAEPERPSKVPLLVGAAALVVALAALGLAAFSGTRSEDADDGDAAATAATAAAVTELEDRSAGTTRRVDQLDDTLAGIQRSLAEINQRLGTLSADDNAAGDDIDALERRVEELRALDSVPARVASIERSVTALRGMSSGSLNAFALAQAEHLLQIANAEVELAGNPDVALAALEMADERLLSVGDPGLTDVRRVLSAEMRALGGIERSDVAGSAVALGSLAASIATLPLENGELPRTAAGADASVEGLSGTERAMATLRNAFSGAFSVRRTDEKVEPLMAPDAAYYLSANLALQLQAARLALLKGEPELVEASLDDAESWLRDYYDLEDPAVTEALATLDEVRRETVMPALPDVSESLRLLRQYIAFEDAAASLREAVNTRPQRANAQSQPANARPQPANAQPEPAPAQPEPGNTRPEAVTPRPEPQGDTAPADEDADTAPDEGDAEADDGEAGSDDDIEEDPAAAGDAGEDDEENGSGPER